MNGRYARQIHRECRKLKSYAVEVAKAQMETQVREMSFSQRVRFAINVLFRKSFEVKKEAIK